MPGNGCAIRCRRVTRSRPVPACGCNSAFPTMSFSPTRILALLDPSSSKPSCAAATDAACEGLNLQTLGTLINVDLPWNPSRLEQRLGRIKRFGQARRTVDMLNLVYHDTQDEQVYQVLSRRLKDKFDIFGGLPDTIEDDWIESVEKPEAMMDQYIHLRPQSRDVFELRYKETIDPAKNRWELCSRVLARRDVVEKLSEAW